MIESFIFFSAILALFSILKKEGLPNSFFWLILILLIIFDGLRWQMGTDWNSYKNAFDESLDSAPPGFEIGFVAYLHFFRSLTDNYSVFLFFTTAFIYLGVFVQIFKMTRGSYLSVFYLMGTLTWYSGSLRQMIALVFFIMAINACLQRKLIKYFFLMIITALFHTTSLFFFFMYWLYGLSPFIFTFLFFSLTGLIFYFKSFLQVLANFAMIYGSGKDYSVFLGGASADGEGNPFLGLLRKFITYFGIVFFAKKILIVNENLKQKEIYFYVYMSLLSIVTYVIGIYLISAFSSRTDIYVGIITTSIIIGIIDSSLNSKSYRIIFFLFICIVIAVYYSRLLYFDLFHPYSSIFFNSDYERELY